MQARHLLALLITAPLPVRAQAQALADQSYFVFVASAAVDLVTLIRFGSKGPLIEHYTSVNLVPNEVAGPRDVAVAPGGRFYYVTTARGFPTGELLKIAIAGDSNPRISQPSDTIKAGEPLGGLPGSIAISPDGGYAWIANAESPPGTKTSSISVVFLDQMVEVARIETCGMAQGSRLTADGTRHYSVCTDDDQVVEIDVGTMKVTRRLAIGAGCAPTWAEPTADGSRIYVACSKTNDVVEVDASSWIAGRRIPMGANVYHLALTHDGKLLLGTNRGGQSVSVVDVATGRELARLTTARRGPSGVVISPDDRYAFVTSGGEGTDRGAVDIIDLNARRIVAVVDVGPKAGGIGFWKLGR